VTLSIHFVAVEMLLGGLLLAVILSLSSKTQPRVTARALASRMSTVMTYLINFGVPPLLFAQVLYGRALYTSSVLIGLYWISVTFLLMLCYALLYRFAGRLNHGKPAWLTGLGAWLTAGLIARILSSNMTLMLRPEAWPSMYATSSSGVLLPSGDPTLLWRWLFAFSGGAMVAGLWLIYLSARSTFREDDAAFMSRLGGVVTMAGAALSAFIGYQVAGSQPGIVQAALANQAVYHSSGFVFVALAAAEVLTGLLAWARLLAPVLRTLAIPLLALLTMASAAIYRDGIRDLTLAAKGFDVWAQPVVTNWSIVLIFVLLFLGAVGVVIWLARVVASATKESESVTAL
jgi:hypothetical protein